MSEKRKVERLLRSLERKYHALLKVEGPRTQYCLGALEAFAVIKKTVGEVWDLSPEELKLQ